MKHLLIPAILLGLLSVTQAEDTEKPAKKKKTKTPIERFEGTYTYVKGMSGTEMLPPAMLEGSTVIIADGTMTTLDKKSNKSYVVSIKLGEPLKGMKNTYPVEMKTLKVGNMEDAEGLKSTGLIGRKKGQIMVKYALPGGESPTDFEPEENTNLFVLEKAKKTKKKLAE